MQPAYYRTSIWKHPRAHGALIGAKKHRADARPALCSMINLLVTAGMQKNYFCA